MIKRNMRQFGLSALAALLVTSAALPSFAAAPVRDAASSSEARMQRLEQAVQDRSKLVADLVFKISALEQEIADLRGIIEEQQYQLGQITERQRELYIDIDGRLQALENGGAGSSSIGATDATGTPSEQEDALYNAGVDMVKARKLTEAQQNFQNYLNEFPQGQYAANAHYWVGLIEFNQKKFPQAEVQFQKVASEFPDSTKAAEAWLKIGQIKEAAGDNAAAANAYQQVVNRYSSSSAAVLAKEKLDGLR